MEDNSTLLLCLASIMFVVFGLVGRAILGAKGYSKWLGFTLGAVGGIIGIIVALVLPKATKPSGQPVVAATRADPPSGVPRSVTVTPSPGTPTQPEAVSGPPSGQRECPVCGYYPARQMMHQIEYTCPFCQSKISIREKDIPLGEGIQILCSSCRKALHLPAQIWCPECKKGVVKLDQLLQIIADENGVSIEKLKQEAKPLEVEELMRMMNQYIPKKASPLVSPEIPDDFDALVLRMLELIKESDKWSRINGPALYKDHPQYSEAQEIGKKLFEMGGRELMEKAYFAIEHHANRSGTSMAQHWWNGIGGWQA